MNKDKQRIAIAEANKFIGPFRMDWLREYDNEGGDAWLFCGIKDGLLAEIPDYLNDLNAMHEVEKTLSDEQFFDWSKDKRTDMSYNGHLFRLVDNSTPENRPCRYHSPTAAQRAEAFLRTLGLWEEGE
jgi:hypothetical protein